MLALVCSGEAIFALPFVLVRIFRPTVLEVFAIDNTELGAAFSAYGIVAMASYLLGGPLADRFPARRLMTGALLGTALGGLYFATMPDRSMLPWLYAWFGFITILPFWAALLRVTREWGGDDAQGRAYGLLDGGRGLVAALVSTFSVAIFAAMLPDAANATLEAKQDALQSAILYFTLGTALAAIVVWFLVPERPVLEKARTEPRIDIRQIGRVFTIPTLWLQSLVVICAYVSYKGTDDFSLLAADALGYDDVGAAWVGTAAFWVRPFAAVLAGLLADRTSGTWVIGLSFGLMGAVELFVAGIAGLPSVGGLLLVSILATSVFVYALRGVYFAIFDEGHVPWEVTGTAVGVVSVLGYTPDVFFGPLMGVLLDASPGIAGHQHLFLVLAGFAAVGLGSTLAFRLVAARMPVAAAEAA